MATISERRNRFLDLVSALVDQVTQWAEPQGWTTKRYPKKMRDADQKAYEAVALFLQKGPTRLLLDPVAYDVPGAEGVMDLALMPTYDDAASLYFEGNGWVIHYAFPPGPEQTNKVAEARVLPLNEDTINQVLDSIAAHAEPSF